MIPRDLIHHSLHKEEQRNGNRAMEPTCRERKPNKKVELVGTALTLLAALLIVSLYGLSATLLVLGATLITMNGALYLSRRNRDYLWGVAVGGICCAFYLVVLSFF